MDDIRRPYRGERRNYAIPSQRQPGPPPPDITDLRPAPTPQPQPHHQPNHQPQHHAQPHHPRYETAPEPAPYHRPAQPHQPHPAAHKRFRVGINKQVVILTVVAAAAVIGGYLLLKPEQQKTFSPSSLAKQASFSFYYPSPLPAGYSYVNNINTFQAGQAYYMIGNGTKHVIVHEQPASGNSLNLATISNPVTFDAAGGKAALGNVTGQPAGLVLTGSTLITLNTTGAVAPADLATIINNLKLVNH